MKTLALSFLFFALLICATGTARASGDPLFVTVKGTATHEDGSPFVLDDFWLVSYPDLNTVAFQHVVTNKRGDFRTKIVRGEWDVMINQPGYEKAFVLGHISAFENLRHVSVIVP